LEDTGEKTVDRDILGYYANPNASIETKKHQRARTRTLADLEQLKRMPVATPATLIMRSARNP
jgi:hypothetical protein